MVILQIPLSFAQVRAPPKNPFFGYYVLSWYPIAPLQDLVMSNPDGTVFLHNKGGAFVDDSYLAVSNDSLEHPIDSTIANLQQLSQIWEHSLFSMGGAYNLPKSFCILMSCKWKHGVATLLTPTNHNSTLPLTAGFDIGNPVSIPQLSPFWLLSYLMSLPIPIRGYIGSLWCTLSKINRPCYENSGLEFG
jgi:hypothetical protein